MSKRTPAYGKLALSLAIALSVTAPMAMAQNTSSNITGRVSDATTQAVDGAAVTITHLPSGTVSQATTDEQGRYAARGLRVGGPYRVTIVKDGKTQTIDDVFLQLAQTQTVDASLATGADAAGTDVLDAIQITGSGAPSVFSSDKMGAGTSLNAAQIAALPSIQRSVQDYARLDPRISQTDKASGAISAAGQNNRFNQITIDGVTVNDTFGLQANNLPLLRQPVSMDAIEALDISISAYDVTQRGYTGAGINAVTKSGTNDFKGSVYYIHRDGDWGRQTDERGVKFKPFDSQSTWGGTVGGPIVKDKLFFFAAYEEFKRTSPAPDVGSLVGVTTVQAQQAIDTARTVYGIDAGNFSASALNNEVKESLIKFDWNINDAHRASFRYTKTEQNQVDLARFGGNRLALSSAWFNRLNSFESYVGQWFADWNSDFSTEMKLSYREYLAQPEPLSRLPQFQISTVGGQIALGTEQFRHANLLETKTWNGYFAGTYYVGDHQLRGGIDYEKNDIYNLFVESNFGAYNFANLADFAAGRYNSYALRVPTNGNLDSAAAVWKLNTLGLFVQDTWTVNANLNLTFGLRADVAYVPDSPVFNSIASTRFGYRNDRTIDGQKLVQPRFGFNYTFDGDRAMQVRGGVGLFQGASANVWLSNPFTNNGRTISIYGCGGALPACTGTLPPVSTNPDNQPRLTLGSAATDIDFVSNDLKQPSVWKGNLAIEKELPWFGLVASAELLLISTQDSITYDHLNLGSPTRIAPDGRLMFWNPAGYNRASWNQNGVGAGVQGRFNRDRAYREVLLAKPTKKGDAQSLTLSLQKPMGKDDHWFWQVGYTHGDAHDVNQLVGSISVENWSSRVAFNPNEQVSSRSNFAIRDRFTAAATYRYNFFGDYKTEVGMFYEGRAGRPYSYVFDNDANGDGVVGNDLLYMPSGPGDVLFGSQAEETAFWSYVSSNPYLNAHRGQVVGRNDNYSAWVNQFDMRISQELPGFFKGNKVELWMDILNVGNLLNKKWGHVDEVFISGFGQPQGRGIVEYGGVDTATGRYVYRFNTPDTEVRRDTIGESRWAVQLGLRYKF